MAPFQKRVLLVEALFVIIYWLVALVVPYLFSFQIHRSLADMADYIPRDLALLTSGFTLWFDVYIMQFHRDLLDRLSLDFKFFNPLNAAPFIQVAVGIVASSFMDRTIRAGEGMAEALHIGYVQGKYMTEDIGKFAKLYNEVNKHDKRFSPYKYASLGHGRAIRVIRLNPSDSDTDPLVCSIEEVGLDAFSIFEALSYAWDDGEGDGYVVCKGRCYGTCNGACNEICNSSVLRVSKNCAAALRRIRIQQGKTPKRLWVDAICINQGDPVEKERQLAIMGEIYKKAKRVIVWLGEHDQSSVRVLEFFEVVANSYEKERRRSQARAEALNLVRRWHPFSESLAQFFHRSWFTRMWPIQEVTLPRRERVRMLCGTTEMPFENLRFGWDVLKDLGLLPRSVNLDQAVALQFYIADAIALKREGQNTSTPFGAPLITDLSDFSLSGVMNATRYKACKYPKDKYFALHGVFQELQISFGITPAMYNEQSDAEIMRAIMVECLKQDGNLDALHLCRLAEPYISSYEFVRTRQDPYDSLSTAVFGMTKRMGRVLCNVYKGREPDYVPGLEWRTTLPSWVPDWTQWTSRSPDPIRDIQFHHSYSSLSLQASERPVDAPAEHLKFTSEDSIARAKSEARGPRANQRDATTQYQISGSVLKVDVKILGLVTEIGSVDSIAVLWQVLLPSSYPSLSWPRSSTMQWTRGDRSPDPAFAALVETMINFVWRSRMAQVFTSLRLALKTLSFVDIIAYVGAFTGLGCTGPWCKELLCMRHADIASCPTDGFAMRKQPKRGSYAEVQVVSTIWWMFNNLLNGRKPSNTDMWYDLTSTALATLSYLLWDCRISISESLFGGRYDEMGWWIIAPVYVYIMSILVEAVAGVIGDTAFMLLGQAVIALTGSWGLAVFLVWARAVTLPVLVILGVRACFKSPWLVLYGTFGSEQFRSTDSFTPGMHFFSTVEGVTGNTSGPVQEKDLLVMVKGCSGFSILRQNEAGFIFIGSAYVGSKTKRMIDKDSLEFTEVSLY